MVRNTRRAVIDAPTQARAERMERKLRDYHRIGRRASAQATPDITRLADQHRVTPHLLRRLRTFARQYDASDHEALCQLRRPNGLPLQWGHINYLLVVQDNRQRSALQKRAAKEGWTAPILNAAIPPKYRTERPHGRRMARPKLAAAGLRLLVAEGNFWLRRLEVVLDVARQDEDGQRDGERQEAVQSAVLHMKRMQKTLRDAMAQLALRSNRSADGRGRKRRSEPVTR